MIRKMLGDQQKPFSSQELLDAISDRRIYNRIRKYNIDRGVLKKAELNHEQLVEILNILKKVKKGGLEEET